MKSIFLKAPLMACVNIAVTVALLMPTLGHTAPVAQISASRISGPAPLAVFFDAAGTIDTDTSIDPFRQLGYRFNFGDASSGSWAYSGKPKNEQIGAPLAAHVFEQPGTYTVQVTAKDANGASSNASVIVTVQSADTTFSATKTVCISRTADFSGCPSGGQQVANATSWPSFQSSKRYLLHRGQDFTSFGTITLGSGSGLTDVQLGAFGTGSNPIVGTVDIGSSRTNPNAWNTRNVVMDLDALNIIQDIGGTDLLVFRNTLTRGGMIDVASAFDYWLQTIGVAFPNPTNIFVVENTIDRNYDQAVYSNPNGITGNALRFAILGNNIDRTKEHNIRIWQASKMVIAHNNFTGRSYDSIRHTIKLMAGGLDLVPTLITAGSLPTRRTNQVTIADNQLGSASSNENWLSASAPQNDVKTEGLEDIIWEDNQFRHGTSYSLDIAWAGRRMTERGNVNATSGTVNVSVGHDASLPVDWKGPYFPGQTSMKQRFTGTEVRPLAPASVSVQ